jgi:hypothetical protein
MLNASEAAKRNTRVAEMRAYRAYDEAYLGRGVIVGYVAGGLTLPELPTVKRLKGARKPTIKRHVGKSVRVRLSSIKSVWPASDDLRDYRLRDSVYSS